MSSSSSLIPCRLCLKSCINSKNLYCKNGLGTELYAMVHKYFHPKIVDMEKAKHLTTICVKCSRQICEFQSFQTSVTIAQLQLMENEEEAILKMELGESEHSMTRDFHVLEGHSDDKLCHSRIKVEGGLSKANEDVCYINEADTSGNEEIDESIDPERLDISQPKLELTDIHTSSDDETPLSNYVDNSKETETSTEIQSHNEPTRSPLNDNDYDVVAQRYKCKLCNNSYTQRSSLRRHKERQHAERDKISHKLEYHFDNGTRMFTCNLCGQDFKRRNAIIQHFTRQDCKAHKVDSMNTIECLHCHKVFGTQNILDRHHRSCLANANEFPCRECGKVFEAYEFFRKHRWYHHRAKPKHMCTQCHKGFKNPSHLRDHILSHAKETTYACPFCPVVFKHPSSLVQHKKRLHPQEKAERQPGPTTSTTALEEYKRSDESNGRSGVLTLPTNESKHCNEDIKKLVTSVSESSVEAARTDEN